MRTTAKDHIAHLVASCAVNNILDVVISPGSRNAPLIIAFDAQPEINTYLIHDERSAAFFALGLAEELNRPVALCCTSGSAPLNYAPAVAEAYYRKIPLLILTADRPSELVDQGDGQTIRQFGIYSNYIKSQWELPNHDADKRDEKSKEVVLQMMESLLTEPQGPVHLNIPLAEPLYEVIESSVAGSVVEIKQHNQRISAEDRQQILIDWQKAERKMILIGQQNGYYKISPSLREIITDPSVAVLVENTSNCADFHNINHCIDRSLAAMKEEEILDYAPDLLITIGGAIVSKRIKGFLRKHKPAIHWRVGHFPIEEDTFQSLSASYAMDEADFFKLLTESERAPNLFGAKWKQLDFIAEEKHQAYLEKTEFSDLKAFELILSFIPDDSDLHMANSSVVRYCQLFNPITEVRYFSNRGVSGIDGSGSTALGTAVASNRLMTLISGDISFFYDSNALWNNYLPSHMRLIVINNGGGGIFKYIPGPASTEQLDYFFAEHHGNVEKLAAAFNVHYMKAESTDELEQNLPLFYQPQQDERPVILEINTTSIENERVLIDYFNSLGKA